MHVKTLVVLEEFRVVVDLVAIEFTAVIHRTPDVGAEVDFRLLLCLATEDNLWNWEGPFGKLLIMVFRAIYFVSL